MAFGKQAFSRFSTALVASSSESTALATRPISTGSPPIWKTIGIVVVAAFGRRDCGNSGQRDNRGYLPAYQIGGHRRILLQAALRPSILDRHVAAVDIADLAKALVKRRQAGCASSDDSAPRNSDHRHRRLLRPRRERPRRRRTAEQRDELAASDESCHLIPPAGRAREG